MIIEGVDAYRVTGPMFECVRVALTSRGEDYSAAYVQGISGAAFRAAGPCPCAPTSSAAMEPHELAELFGYATDSAPLGETQEEVDERLPALVARIRDDLRRGRPVVAWHAFTFAEWDVVCGFDEDATLFLGRGSYEDMRGEEYPSAPEGRMGECLDTCPAFGAIFIGDKVGELDARAAELAALEEAVRHARTPEDRIPDDAGADEREWRLRNGLGVYDWWIANPPSSWDYCLDVTRSRRRAATDFMLELAPRYPQSAERMEAAAREFAAEADALDRACQLACDEEAAEAARNAAVSGQLMRAREHYAAAIAEVEAALPALRGL